MVVDPIDPENREPEHVAQNRRDQRSQRRPVGTVWHPHFQLNDRDNDGNPTVADRLEPLLTPPLPLRPSWPPAPHGPTVRLVRAAKLAPQQRRDAQRTSATRCDRESTPQPCPARTP